MPSPFIVAVLLGLLACTDAVLRNPQSQSHTAFYERQSRSTKNFFSRSAPSTKFQYLTNTTKQFAVDGTNIPLYDGDIGESYAGLRPISQKYRVDPNGTDTRELFFWFFPSTNPAASNEITIWLTGGPGCSSLTASLQENGPFVWGPGTAGPVHNPWSWSRLTNIVYVEQPVGVGFSQGTPGLLQDEKDVAKEFLGWWLNFVEAFALQGRKIHITGESYSGYYIPYIADAMLAAADPKFFDVEGVLLVDPLIGDRDLQQQVPHRAMTKEFPHVAAVNKTYDAELDALDDKCGYTAFLNEYLVFPPKGVQPVSPSSARFDGACDMYIASVIAIAYMNPCFYPYEITLGCPYPVDTMRNPPDGIEYFNRTDVKAAINAPPVDWIYCTAPTFANGDTDLSPPVIEDVLPRVIERLKKTMIVTGALDLALPTNGTLLAIQNMTWNGALGFQQAPAGDFFVPYSDAAQNDVEALSGAGLMGTFHEERGLTFVDVFLAGHQLPMWQPAAAFRHLEYLLGRVESLNSTQYWSVQI
ncbi:Carboxypeptidase [Mycena venus]|uniref:Carboxypeptidase n=1 Tax=Mycena venus TaxID=2733690 RepID=A0A8H6YM67_9AGAR|nr:Carboxypeptidase [Mycena venus]